MLNDNPIWIFFHIPRTAGTTLITHLAGNFDRKHILKLYIDKGYFKDWNEIKDFLNHLNDNQIRNINFIYGHQVFYGVHKFFNRPPRYIVFLRDPIERIISYYNFLRMNYEMKNRILGLPVISEEGNIMPFKEWYFKNPSLNNQMSRAILLNGLGDKIYIRQSTPENLEIIKGLLNKFYFVGITENFEEDSKFLFPRLGIKNTFENQSISKKYFTLDQDKELIELLREKNALDYEFYEYAKELNKKMKEELTLLENFDWKTYLDNYPDLKNGIDSEEKAKWHWLSHGKKEGRVWTKIRKNELNNPCEN